MKDSWQCQICGTVYAWWVSRCKNDHDVQPLSQKSRQKAAQLHMALDKELGEETPEYIRKIAEE